MKRENIIIYFSLLAFLAAGLFFAFFQSGRESRACFKNHCFNAELALTSQEQANGLMFREELGRNQGMLFIFGQEAAYSFWMKNTLIPLDIIWMDKDKKVVFITKDAQPCSGDSCPFIKPGMPVKYVFELNAGMADKIGLATGDKMNFVDFFDDL